jgi:adenosylcobinamide-GDP ribazoletransferase
MDHLRALMGGIGFLSTLPVGRDEESYEAFRYHGYMFPIIGAILGGLIGIIGASFSYLPIGIGAAFYVILLSLVRGINHLDGLADFADGLVAPGNQAQKREAMKDSSTGVGGTFSVVAVLLLGYSAVLSLFSLKLPYSKLVLTFMEVEMLATLGMLAMIAFGKSSHPGMASAFIEKNSPWNFIIGSMLAAGITLSVGVADMLALLASLVVTFAIMGLSNRQLGGVGGDVIGATSEMARIAGLVTLVMVRLHIS